MSSLDAHRSRRTWTASTACALAIAAVIGATSTAARSQKEAAAPTLLPLRLTAFAVNMSTVAPGTTARLEIQITRWSTTKEREGLIATAIEKGQNPLLRALQKMPFHGHMSIPGWIGPDPHNARLGWDLRYASSTPLEDGGQRIAIATDRYIGFWEARESPRTIDYPFTLIEIRLDKSGRGKGKMAVATKIEFDKKKNQLVLENYASEPVRLNDVKIDT